MNAEQAASAADSGVDHGPRAPRVGFTIWVGLAAVAVYVALAAVVANLLTASISPRSEAAEFALNHFTVLPILIAAGVLFVRRAGWGTHVWRVPAALETRPRRRWLLAFPIVLLFEIVTIAAQAPLGERSVGLIVLVLAGTLMVGFGEELYFRGILRASVRAHHGEFATLAVTAVVFGLAHTVGSAMTREPGVFIVLQVGATALDGIVLYGVLRATGRLWVVAVLHAFNDAALYLASADVTSHAATGFNPATWTGFAPIVLWTLGLVLAISCIREDLRVRAITRSRSSAPLSGS